MADDTSTATFREEVMDSVLGSQDQLSWSVNLNISFTTDELREGGSTSPIIRV